MATTNDDQKQVPVPLLDTTRPSGGYGSPSSDEPIRPNPQAVKVPGDITRRKK
jgi:hypothetical protein